MTAHRQSLAPRLSLSPRTMRRLELALTAVLVGGAATLLVAASIAVFSSESDRIGFDLRAGYLPAAEAVQDG